MSTLKPVYGTVVSSTIGLNSLANATGVLGTDDFTNSSNLYLDMLVEVDPITASGTIGANPYVSVYAVSSIDGVNYDLNNAKLIGTVDVPASATQYYSALFSVADAFGGILPEYFNLYIVNNTGLALGSTGNTARLLPVNAQVV